jgi:hypothetical protein
MKTIKISVTISALEKEGRTEAVEDNLQRTFKVEKILNIENTECMPLFIGPKT